MIYFITLIIQLTLLLFLSTKTKNLIYSVVYRLTNNKSVAISVLSLLLYPGVVVHELSHLIVAAVLLVPVKDFNLVPVKTDEGIRSGSVTIAKTDIVRKTLIGIAPLFAGILALWAVTVYVMPPLPLVCNNSTGSFTPFRMTNNSHDDILCTNSKLPISQYLNFLISIYLLFSISSAMYSSRKDLEALKIMVPFIVAVTIVAYLVGFGFDQVLRLLDHFTRIYQLIAEVLLLPIFIQGVLFVALVSVGRLQKPVRFVN